MGETIGGDRHGLVLDAARSGDDRNRRSRATPYGCRSSGGAVERSRDRDLADAEAAVDQLAAVSAHHAWVISDVWLLRPRALLAQAHGDETAYRDYRDRYRAMATSLSFEGHMRWAEYIP
jgi:hypothetical protein